MGPPDNMPPPMMGAGPSSSISLGGSGSGGDGTERAVAFGRSKRDAYWPTLNVKFEDGKIQGWPYTHLVHWSYDPAGVIELDFVDHRVIKVRIAGRNLDKGFEMLTRREVGWLHERHIGEMLVEDGEPYIEGITIREQGGAA